MLKSFTVFESKSVKRKFRLKERSSDERQIIHIILFIVCILLVIIYIYQHMYIGAPITDHEGPEGE